MTTDLKVYLSKNEKKLSDVNRDAVMNFLSKVDSCSNKSLYRFTEDGLRLVSHLSCDKRICNICNWKRQKQIRRKYFKFFKENSVIHQVKMPDFVERRHCFKNELNKLVKSGWEDCGTLGYDLMHLTLTVPHTMKGYKGKVYYFDELMKDFNLMRKKKFWNFFVYGGEFGVECTFNENGFHVHIHSLLIVKQFSKNRNDLFQCIFKNWNKITSENKIKISPERRIDVRKSFPSTSDTEFNSWNLYEDGATMVGLENIYYYDSSKKKVYCQTEESRIRGVLETISYHFKPKMFTDSLGRLRAEMVVELVPVLHKKHLYQKFGVLRNEKSLNLNHKHDIEEEFAEVAEMVNEDTGEVITTKKEYSYFVMNPLKLRFDSDENPIAYDLSEPIHATGTAEAVSEFSNKYLKFRNKR